MSKPGTKQPETVRLDELKSNTDRVSRLASRRGGVLVIDDLGAECFRLVLPATAIK